MLSNWCFDLPEDSSKKHPFPCPCSYRTALLHYVDITSNPRTHILKELIEYTTDEKVRIIRKRLGGGSGDLIICTQLYARVRSNLHAFIY